MYDPYRDPLARFLVYVAVPCGLVLTLALLVWLMLRVAGGQP